MSVSGPVTIGGSGQPVNVAFTVTGTATLGYATQFENAVNSLTGAGGVFQNLTPPTTGGGAAVVKPGTPGGLYYFTDGLDTVTIPAGGGYTFDQVGGAVTIQGSTAGTDSVLVAAVNASTTYLSSGGDNTITFVEGTNEYIGTANTVGGDTVVTGSGSDTVLTGLAATTVFTGTGHSSIYLNDTASGGNFNDLVWVHDGISTIYANGVNDFIGADAAGQTILGSSVTGGTLTVLLSPVDAAHTDGTQLGNNVVAAGGATTYVFNDSSGNSIYGGSALLGVISGTNVTGSVVGGTGQVVIFGNSGDTIAFANTAGDTATATFVANGGAENFFGGNGTTKEVLFGYNTSDTAAAAQISETLVGGNGNDLLVSGAGNETLVGGSANNTYLIGDPQSGGANIVLANFGTDGHANLLFDGNFAQSDIQQAIANGVAGTYTFNGTTSADYTITFNDGSTVTFVGINSASELNGKIV